MAFWLHGAPRAARWKIVCSIVLTFTMYSGISLQATDTKPEDARLYTDTLGLSNRFAGLPLSLSFKVNNNNVLPAEQYRINVSVRSLDGTTLHVDTTTVDTLDLPPFTRREYTFRHFWIPPAPGQYRFSMNVNYENDIDRSNDTLSATLDILPGRTSLRSVLRRTMFNSGTDTLVAGGFMLPVPLPAGTTLDPFDSVGTAPVVLDREMWVGYLTPNLYTRFSQPSVLVLVDAGDTTGVTIRPMPTWPLYNGVPLFPNPADTATLLFTPPPRPYTAPTTSIHLPALPLAPGGRAGAVLISGPGWNTADQRGLDSNVRRMREEYTFDSLSLRIPPGNIHILNAPTTAMLYDSLNHWQDAYDTLTVFYSGHADNLGRPLLHDGVGYYQPLLTGLFSSGAHNINLVLDNNYASTVIDSVGSLVRSNALYHPLNITLLTSSAADKTARDIRIAGDGYTSISEFTLGLTRSMGHPEADSNSVPGVSLAEAYARLRRTNPMLQTGGRMDTAMCPQLWLQRGLYVGLSARLEFSDADLALDLLPQQPVPSTTLFTVQMSTPPFTVLPADTTAVSISTGRIWHLDVEPAVPFLVDMEFRYRSEYDTLAPASGSIPGLVRRSQPGAAWSAHYPTVWNETNRTLTAQKVDSTGEWAIAVVKEPASTTGVAENPSHLFHVGDIRPNPFASATTVRFECKKAGVIDLAIVDLTGNRIQTLASGLYQPGVYHVVFDGSALGNGMYFCRLYADGLAQTRLLLHSR